MNFQPFGSGWALITGACGFLGRHVAGALADTGWKTLGIGRAGPPDGGPTLHAFVDAEVNADSLATLLEGQASPAAVFHMAGTGSVGRSIADPARGYADTVDTTAALLDVLGQKAPEAVLVYPSSASVYGNRSQGARIGEDAETWPVSPYGRNKLIAEQLLREAGESFGLRCGVLRFFSVYGPGLKKQLLWDIYRKLREDPARLSLSGTGDETRDFLHVADAIDLCLRTARAARERSLTVNGGTGRATTVRDMATKMVTLLGAAPEIRFSGTSPPGDPRHLVADTTLAERLGFVPAWNVDDGLADYLDWLATL